MGRGHVAKRRGCIGGRIHMDLGWWGSDLPLPSSPGLQVGASASFSCSQRGECTAQVDA